MRFFTITGISVMILLSCQKRKTPEQEQKLASDTKGTFAFDVDFLKEYEDVIVLGGGSNPASLVIVKDYQARVMTSTANGEGGNSYGWINYDLIASGKVLPHINPLGGEDRFWLGPEGGQYALFFKKGDPFKFENWQTPPVIDTETFDLIDSDSMSATFHKTAKVSNYQGTVFQIDILREIRLMNALEINETLGMEIQNVNVVGFESINTISNAGETKWSESGGLISIWILGMFNPSPETTIVVPYLPSAQQDKLVTTDYFGAIPADRLVKKDSFLLFKGDGAFRGKVGIAPSIARDVAGSYDAKKKVLTIVRFDLVPTEKYVNSKWETQKEPFMGDAVNSYNDGPLADGSQLGPFYELESSSPGLALKPGEAKTHEHATIHIEGDPAQLDAIARKVLGVRLEVLSSKF